MGTVSGECIILSLSPSLAHHPPATAALLSQWSRLSSARCARQLYQESVPFTLTAPVSCSVCLVLCFPSAPPAVNDVVAKFKAQAAANRALNEVNEDLYLSFFHGSILIQGGHDVAQILEITSKLGEDELSALLRGIAERSQERDKVGSAVNLTSYIMWISFGVE